MSKPVCAIKFMARSFRESGRLYQFHGSRNLKLMPTVKKKEKIVLKAIEKLSSFTSPLENLEQPSSKNLSSQKIAASYSMQGHPLREGQRIRIEHTGKFQCNSCEKEVKKIFDGFCYPCFKTKAAADLCVMNPHKCHFHVGTCREPEWGVEHCFQKHYVYFAYTDKFKVGITRQNQIPTRWIDQGASSACVIAEVPNRFLAGIIEKQLTQFVPDKTHWMKMLTNFNHDASSDDWYNKILELKNSFIPQICSEVANIYNSAGTESKKDHLENVAHFFDVENKVVRISYPQNLVDKSASKISSINLEKNPVIDETILGIKGQYLYFKSGVMNVRRHTGYLAQVDVLN
jgi:Protein of unknown function (DUF2797)